MTPLRSAGPRALAVGMPGVAVLLGAIAYAGWSAAAQDDSAAAGPAGLTTGAATVEGELAPGGAVTGSLVVRTGSTRAVRVTSARFEPAGTTSPGCDGSRAVLALTVEPSAAAPLVLPPGTATALGWTAFLPGDAADACQGARFTSTLVLDGQRVGRVEVDAARLTAPGRPVGGLTTPTRAAVTWAAAPGTQGYVVERAPSGTTAWVPACGTSTTPLPATSCTDTGLQPDTAYAYRVTSVRGAWRAVGRFSADVTTQPECPC